jgi:hypothetical protein
MTPNRSTRRRESDEVEWVGNPLCRGGTTGTLGVIRGELLLANPELFLPPDGTRVRGAVTRTWILNIIDTDSMSIEGQCLSTLMLFDMMPEKAKREAEQIIRWAYAYSQPTCEVSQ